MNREELEDLMLLYASGAADESERAAAEAKLASGDPAARDAYSQAMEIAAQIPLGLDLAQPSKSIRDQLLFRVAANVQQERIESNNLLPWSTKLVAGIAAVLAIALTITLMDRNRLMDRVSAMEVEKVNVNRILESPYVSLAKLDSQSKVKCSGRVLYCPVQKEYEVVVFNLKPPSPGKVYELWLITPNNTKMPAGTFNVDGNGNGIINFKAPKTGTFALAAITDEPEGGSPQPTGEIHLVGNLQVQ